MKVLFVCRQNVGRSQMAKAFYNAMTHTNNAEAAGTNVNEIGQTLRERKETSKSKNFFVLDVMNDVRIDMANYTRSPLKYDLLAQYDKIVSMVGDADTPAWLLESSKYIHWDVKDPRGQDYATTARVRDEIKAKVMELISK